MGRIADVSELLLELGLSSSVTEEERALADAALDRAESDVRRYLRYDPALGVRTEYYPQRNQSISGSQGVWEANETSAYLRRLTEASTSELLVQHLPVRSAVPMQLWIDYDGRSGAMAGAFAASTLKVEGLDYWPNYDGLDSAGNKFCRDGVLRSIGLWPLEAGSVKVTYQAGYTDDELHGRDSVIDAGPIVDAIVVEAARRFRKAVLLKKSASTGFLAGPVVSESLGSYSYSVDSSALKSLFGSSQGLCGEATERLNEFVNWGWGLGG